MVEKKETPEEEKKRKEGDPDPDEMETMAIDEAKTTVVKSSGGG